MELIDPMDPRIVGWWEIKESWNPENGDSEAEKFPADGFVQGHTLVILEAGANAYNIFWSDKDRMPCSLHYPEVSSQTRVTFAGHSFLCWITPTLVQPDSTESLELTVTLTTGSQGLRPASGNTGTFIAQAVPGPQNHPHHGHEKHGHEKPGN